MNTSLLIVSVLETIAEVSYVVTALAAVCFVWWIYKDKKHIKNIDE